MKNFYSSTKYTLVFLTIFFASYNSKAQCPTFTLNQVGLYIGCNPTVVTVYAINTSTLSNVTYTWLPSGSIGSSHSFTTSGNYTINASSPSSTCISTQSGTNFTSSIIPNLTVTPTNPTLTCLGTPITFTAITTPTGAVGVDGYAPGGVAMTYTYASSYPTFSASNPGTYTFIATSYASGCSTTKTVAVSSITTVPTMSVNALSGYTIDCNNVCLLFNISASPGPAPKTYTWTNITTSVSTTPPTGGYTICTPGNYIATYKDGNACTVSEMLTVSIDTSKAFLTITSSKPVLCLGQSASLTAIGANSYTWNPGSLTGSPVSVSPAVTTTYTISAKGSNGCVGKSLFTQSVTICTGIGDFKNSSPVFNLYPNPTDGEITILYTKPFENVKVKLFNLSGQLVMEKSISFSDQLNLSIFEIIPGLYLMELNTDGELSRVKLIKN